MTGPRILMHGGTMFLLLTYDLYTPPSPVLKLFLISEKNVPFRGKLGAGAL